MYAYCLLLQYITRFSMGIAIISSFLYFYAVKSKRQITRLG